MFLFHLSCSFTCNRSLQLYNRSFYTPLHLRRHRGKTGYSVLRAAQIRSQYVRNYFARCLVSLELELSSDLTDRRWSSNRPNLRTIVINLIRSKVKDLWKMRSMLEDGSRRSLAAEIATTMTRVFPFFSFSFFFFFHRANDAHRPPAGSTFRLNAGV